MSCVMFEYNLWKPGVGNQNLTLVVRDYLEVFREIMRDPRWKDQFGRREGPGQTLPSHLATSRCEQAARAVASAADGGLGHESPGYAVIEMPSSCKPPSPRSGLANPHNRLGFTHSPNFRLSKCCPILSILEIQRQCPQPEFPGLYVSSPN